VEIVRRAVLEIFDVLDIEVVDAQAHAEVLAFDRHGFPSEIWGSSCPGLAPASGLPPARSTGGRVAAGVDGL
jgi:hypothetical protein